MLMICQKLNRGLANVISKRLDPESTKNSREYRTELRGKGLLQTFVVGKLRPDFSYENNSVPIH